LTFCEIESYTMSALHSLFSFEGEFHSPGPHVMLSNSQSESEENNFVEFRRKVRARGNALSAMEWLLRELQFTGRLSVVVQNGRVLKSGYEEGYFRRPTVF
jgi:hypothetical protein